MKASPAKAIDWDTETIRAHNKAMAERSPEELETNKKIREALEDFVDETAEEKKDEKK